MKGGNIMEQPLELLKLQKIVKLSRGIKYCDNCMEYKTVYEDQGYCPIKDDTVERYSRCDEWNEGDHYKLRMIIEELEDKIAVMKKVIKGGYNQAVEDAAAISAHHEKQSTDHGDLIESDDGTKYLPGVQVGLVADFAHISQECMEIKAEINALKSKY